MLKIDSSVNFSNSICTGNIKETGVEGCAVFNSKTGACTDNSITAINCYAVFDNSFTVEMTLFISKISTDCKISESTDITADIRITDNCGIFKTDISPKLRIQNANNSPPDYFWERKRTGEVKNPCPLTSIQASVLKLNIAFISLLLMQIICL